MKLAQVIKKGFTLIELLVVIGILAILLAITLIAINPARQFQQANDTKRTSDVNAILNAIGQYSADNNGDLPSGVDATVREINGTVSATTTGNDFCTDLVPLYIAALPVDPTPSDVDPVNVAGCATAYDTQYTVAVVSGRVTVSAPNTQVSATDISVTR